MSDRHTEAVYSIGAVAAMLGLSASTLRAWEDRYGVIVPARTNGSQRLYSRSQVEQLRFIKRQLERGASAADAHRLLAGSEKAHPTPGSGAAAVETGIQIGVEQIPLHSHLAAFYDTDFGRLRIGVPFLAEGIRAGQPAFLIASGPVLDAFMEALGSELGLDMRKVVDAGRLVVIDSTSGTTPEEGLRYWEETLGQPAVGGAPLVRAIGEMSCEQPLFASDAEMIRFEYAFNPVAKRFPIISVCLYDVRVFSAKTVFDAMKAHTDLYPFRIGSFLN